MAVNYYGNPNGSATGMQSLIAASYSYESMPRATYETSPYTVQQPSSHPDFITQESANSISRQGSVSSHNGGMLPGAGKSNNIAQWLLNNYEVAEGLSLPRQTVYEQYEEYCRQSKQDPINAASFGKLIRAIFPNLKTRRLGTRGNSKYHYYGIRVKPQPSHGAMPIHMRPIPQELAPAPVIHPPIERLSSSMLFTSSPPVAPVPSTPAGPAFPLPAFPSVDPQQLSEGVTPEAASSFLRAYHAHGQRLLDIVYRHGFGDVESILEEFWRGTGSAHSEVLADPHMVTLVGECDVIAYETMVSCLIPDALEPLKPHVTKAIRNFAKQLDGWLVAAFAGIDAPELLDVKRKAGRQFSQALRRHTSLNHLAQAARAVLGNPQQLQQMRKDWARIDFTAVKRQALSFCNCQESTIDNLHAEAEELLSSDAPLESWAGWLNGIMDAYVGDPQSEDYGQRARRFLMKWSFVASLVVRDLTLRSSRSFGSFHLMRLLVDEHLTFVAERRLARSAPAQAAAAAAAAAATLEAVRSGLPASRAGMQSDPSNYEEDDDEEEDADLTDVEAEADAAAAALVYGAKAPTADTAERKRSLDEMATDPNESVKRTKSTPGQAE